MAYEEDKYLSDDEESELEIAFHHPDPDLKNRLADELQEMADILGGVGVPELQYPPKGFLVDRLEQWKRKLIEQTLGERYAEKARLRHGDLKMIDIEESREKMVYLLNFFHEEELDVEYSGLTFHNACKTFAAHERIWYLRKQVATELGHVIRAWNAIGLKPHLEDAFRPPEVQEGLFIRRVMTIARRYRDLPWQKVYAIASTITAPSPDLAGHMAGAAVDLRLMRRSEDPDEPGEFLDLGNDYPDGGVLSSIDCPYITQEQFRTRMLFAIGMRLGKFNILRSEDWHGSLGDRGLGIDEEIKQNKAIYGPLQDFNLNTGEVTPFDPAIAEKPFIGNKPSRYLVGLARKHPEEDDDYNGIRKQLAGMSF